MKTKTLKVRVKDKHAPELRRQARIVNDIWNYINGDISSRWIIERHVWLSAFDIQKYTVGSSKDLGIHSHTINEIAKEYVIRRNQFKKAKLKFRPNGGSRKSLGWVPFTAQSISWKNGQVYFFGKYYNVWDSYGLSKYKFRAGSFNEDARGRWYFNVTVSYEPEKSKGTGSVGIDLGCKDSVTTSDGKKMTGRWYRELEEKLKIAQRANKKGRVRAISAKVKNRRKDKIHKLTTELVNENAAIFIGNVSSKKLIQTKMAKSVLDAGWGMTKSILEYKCDHADVVFEVVDEAFTSQVCSSCGCIPSNSPKGMDGLGIREWQCNDCGEIHNRDINAAKNILAVGHGRLAGGNEHGCSNV